MNGYIWYSFGSDTTGPKLAEALGFQSGKKKPNFEDYDIIIGFGCKSKESVGRINAIIEGNLRIINHPDSVEFNRNKLRMLTNLCQAGISVPGIVARSGLREKNFFEEVKDGLTNGVIDFPIIGSSSNHKGATYFCYTLEDIQKTCVILNAESKKKNTYAIDYFRSFCPGTEFRIHVLRDMAIYGQIKTPDNNPSKQTFESLKTYLSKKALKEKKGSKTITEDMEWTIRQIVPELLRGPSQLLRSIGRGWTLENINLKEIPTGIITEAINALDAAGLDLGAISVTYDGSVTRVTNITTAPSISPMIMNTYVSAIEEFMKEDKTSKKKTGARKKKEIASPELVARLTRKIRGIDIAKIEELLKTLDKE